jgi:signal transduction histidine kinase
MMLERDILAVIKVGMDGADLFGPSVSDFFGLVALLLILIPILGQVTQSQSAQETINLLRKKVLKYEKIAKQLYRQVKELEKQKAQPIATGEVAAPQVEASASIDVSGWDCSVVILDQELRITDHNSKASELLQYLESSLIGKQITSVFPHTESLWKKFTSEGDRVGFDLSAKKAGVEFHGKAIPLYNKDGNFAFLLIDFTESTKRELMLAEQLEAKKYAEKELKLVIDKQLETNEQLLIAESKYKAMLEKEQESKAVLNQTLTALKDTQGQLVHNEKMASLGQLTAGIAHEINNPINFIYNGIGSLKSSLEDLSDILDAYAKLDEGADPSEIIPQIKEMKEEYEYDHLREDLDEMIVDVKEGAIRTIEIVKGLRVFSRLDEEDRKEANINECVDATLVLLKNKTKTRIAVNKQLDDQLPNIECYPGQLNQVFMNIINNAIQAIPEERKDGELSIATSHNEKSIIIKVRDNGSGMSEEVKRRIFEPFYTTKPVGVGTGLGMSISYGIIEKHHGKIECESQEGVGTEFTITLPKFIEEYAKVI